jgi:hypothetical protein
MRTSTTHAQKVNRESLRFAHPFLTGTPFARRALTLADRGCSNYIQTKLQGAAKPKSTPVMTLADIIGTPGTQDIEKSGKEIGYLFASRIRVEN